MSNDIEIRVRVTNQTASGLNSVNASLRTLTTRGTAAAAALNRLEQQAQDTTRALRRLARQADDTAVAMASLTASAVAANAALRTLNSRVTSATTNMHDMDDQVRVLRHDMDQFGDSVNYANGHLGNLRGSLGRITVAGQGASSALGKGGGAAGGGGGMAGSLMGIGAAIGVSVLPALGALSPMLFGLAAVGGAASLAMDDLKKEFKKLKPEFEALQKTASKAVMPGVKRSMDDIKGAMKGLHPVVKEGGKAFGDFVARAGEFANSPAFKSSLLKNVEMGSKFFGEFTDSLLEFTQSFLDFGTKSQPTLDSFQNLFGGMLDSGLPSMFKEMERGIGGSSEVIDGFASLLNDSLLPSIGKIAGSFSEAFGPLMGEMLETAGGQIELISEVLADLFIFLRPLGAIVADAFRAWNELFAIGASVAGDFAKEVGGALFQSLAELAGIDTSKLDDGFTGLSDWVKDNQGQIRAGMLDIAASITGMVAAGIAALPELFSVFRTVTEGVLLAIDGLVSGLATAFGDLPVVGDKFEEWNTSFDDFAEGFRSGMDDTGETLDEFVDKSIPRLNRAQIKLNVDQAEASLEHIKAQLKDPELTRERKAKLTADKKDAEDKLAAAKQELSAFDKKEAKAKLDAESGGFWGKIRDAMNAKIPTKTGMVVANTGGFWAGVRGLAGRVLGTSYINVQYRKVDSTASPTFKAMGGPIRRLAGGGASDGGGRVAGPGTETSDSIPAMLSAGEYVVRASSVRKYGEGFMNALNSGHLKIAGFAKGGKISDKMRDARKELADQLDISHFGRKAGYTRTPAEKALGDPADLKSLVSALNGMRGDIKRSFSGKTESRLLKQLSSSGKALIKWEKKLGDIGKSLDKAKDKLNNLKDAAGRLRDSVTSGLKGEANITRSASGAGQVTINTLLSQMTGSAANTKQFAQMLDQLKKKGLSGDLIAQIAEAGISGGGMETAAAVLGGGESEIKRLNELQKEIGKSAKKAGKTASDAMYAAGIKAAEGLVKGLEKKQKAIEKTMMRIAKSMEKALRKALGIKSPSKVMEQLGDYTAEGFSIGVKKNRSVTPAWESMLNAPRGGGPTRELGSAGGHGNRMIVIHNTITLDGKVVARQIIDPLRSEIAHRGGNVQQSLGRG